MTWVLTTEFTVEETKTGFVIYLLSGSWDEPMEIKASPPKGMSALAQARHLREGLAFAELFIRNREKYRTPFSEVV